MIPTVSVIRYVTPLREGGSLPASPFLRTFADYAEDMAHAARLHEAGTLRALRSAGAGLDEVLAVLV